MISCYMHIPSHETDLILLQVSSYFVDESSHAVQSSSSSPPAAKEAGSLLHYKLDASCCESNFTATCTSSLGCSTDVRMMTDYYVNIADAGNCNPLCMK
jgi:hypothetical protein